MVYYKGNVFLSQVFTPRELTKNRQKKFFQWALEHGTKKVTAFYNNNSLFPGVYTLRIEDCILSSEEMDAEGRLKVCGHSAYVGELQVLATFDEGETPAEDPMNFVRWLTEFFEQSHMSEEEKERTLQLTLKEFLGVCKTAAEQRLLEVTKNNGAPAEAEVPEAPLTKMEVIAGKATCRVCHKAKLHIVDGLVKCPICNYVVGDIDDLA